MESAKNTAESAHDKACDATNSTQAQAQQSKEEKAGFLQQVCLLKDEFSLHVI